MSGETAPALVLQMQRMGDIVLSFPLFLWLKRHAPARPVWVVAEPVFYDELKELSPPVVYIPWTATAHLESHRYSLIVNLSHRPEAAALAGRLEAAVKVGPVADANGALRVRGAAQLYRASLTHNNRHNRFHWAELNALGSTDLGVFAATHFDPPRWPKRREKSVGLFVGASEENKRPDVPFYAELAFELERRGLKVALFGGPGDVEFGREVEQTSRGRPVNLCGRLALRQFVAAGQTLDMLVTPDTGPMHVAAWSGLATLNLSMGPVSPWETGPFPPGHFVLRAAMSCLGCWRCRFDEPRCRNRFRPRDVAYLVSRLLATGGDVSRVAAPRGTRLFRTGRTPDGLYDLERVGALGVGKVPLAREAVPVSGAASVSKSGQSFVSTSGPASVSTSGLSSVSTPGPSFGSEFGPPSESEFGPSSGAEPGLLSGSGTDSLFGPKLGSQSHGKGVSPISPPVAMRFQRSSCMGTSPESGLVAGFATGVWPGSAGDVLGEFWRAAFGAHFGLLPGDRPALAWAGLVRTHPRLALALARHLADLARRARQAMAASPADPGQGFWLGAAPLVRPLAGFMHMWAQNGDFTPQAWLQALKPLEVVLAACS